MFFVPGEANFHSGFAYELSELEPRFLTHKEDLREDGKRLPSSRPVPEEWLHVARTAAALQGVRSTALVDRTTGRMVLREGEPFNADLVLKLLRVQQTATDERIENALLTSDTYFHFLQSLSEIWSLYLRVNREQNPNVGLVQFQLRELLRT